MDLCKFMRKAALTCALAVSVNLTVYAGDVQERVSDYAAQNEDLAKQEPSKYIFIGDSRTVGMQMAVGGTEKDVWSAKESIGYDWMVSNGIPDVEGEIEDGTAVFILLGVNDLYRPGTYADTVNAYAEEWNDLGADTYFVSVGPVSSSYAYLTGDIEGFNSVICDSAVSYDYIDLYGAMVQDGYDTADGLHYTNSTYQYIYDFLEEGGWKDDE